MLTLETIDIIGFIRAVFDSGLYYYSNPFNLFVKDVQTMSGRRQTRPRKANRINMYGNKVYVTGFHSLMFEVNNKNKPKQTDSRSDNRYKSYKSYM